MNPPDLDLHAELEQRLRFEMLLTELSARFVSVTEESIDDEIVNAQRQIVEALDLDRSVLAQLKESGDGFIYTHCWFRPGLEPSSGSGSSHGPWMAEKMMQGQVVYFSRIDDLPEEAVEEKEFGRRHGIFSSATFPLRVGGKVIGVTSFGTLHREREWPDTIIHRLRLFVEMIGSAIARTRGEKAIRETADEVRRLRDQLQRENVYLQMEVRAFRGNSHLVGESTALRYVLSQAEQVAPTNSSVLLLGETGTGKELMASVIHELSPRNARPMVRVS